MKRRWLLVAKLLVMAAVVGFLAWQVHKQWFQIAHSTIQIDWRFAPLGVLGFIGVFLTSGLVWLWMARRMGDRSPALALLGAYIFSQVGKYVPGKVFLLFLRIERTSRAGMAPGLCTLATVLENAMYMLSGALVAAVTLAVFVRDQPLYLVLTLAGVVLLGGAFHPMIFYRVIDLGLAKFKRPPIDAAHRLALRHLVLAVVLFLPCWAFGGLAVWASCRSVTMNVPPTTSAVLPGAFSSSVIGGMAVAVAPGGLGSREIILGAILNPVLTATPAQLLLAVVLQRLFQIVAEVLLGLVGALLTARVRTPSAAETPQHSA